VATFAETAIILTVDIFKIFWANPSYQQQTLRWFFPKRQPYTIPAVLH